MLARGHRVYPSNSSRKEDPSDVLDQIGVHTAGTLSEPSGDLQPQVDGESQNTGNEENRQPNGQQADDDADWYDAGWGGPENVLSLPQHLRIVAPHYLREREDTSPQKPASNFSFTKEVSKELSKATRMLCNPIWTQLQILLEIAETNFDTIHRKMPEQLLGSTFFLVGQTNPYTLVYLLIRHDVLHLIHQGLEAGFMIATLGACMTIATRPDDLSASDQVKKYDFAAVVLLTAEVLLHSFTYGVGLPKPKHANHADVTLLWHKKYKGFNRLDVLVLAGGWVEVIFAANGMSRFTVRPLRMFRALFVLSRLLRITVLDWIWAALKRGQTYAWGLLLIVLSMLLCLSALCTHMYGTSYQTRCVLPSLAANLSLRITDSNTLFETSPSASIRPASATYATLLAGTDLPFPNLTSIFTSNLTSNLTSSIQLNSSVGALSALKQLLPWHVDVMVPETWCYDSSSSNADLVAPGTCPPPFVCAVVGEPSYGFSHFEHMGGSLPVLSSIVTLDEFWVHISRVRSAQASWWWISVLLFIGIVISGHFIVLNLLMSVGMCLFGEFLHVKEGRSCIRARVLSLDVMFPAEQIVGEIKPIEGGSRAVFTSRAVLRRLLASQTFKYFSLACILFDACVRLSWRVGMSQDMLLFLTWTETGMIIFFVFESAVRGYASGSLTEFQRTHGVWGILEIIIIAVSAIALTLSRTGLSDKETQACRHVIMIRLLKVAYEAVGTRAILSMMHSTVTRYATAMLFLTWCILITALMGRMLFGDAYEGLEEPGGVRKVTFRNYLNSCMAMMRILTGDDWSNIAFDGMLAADLMAGRAHAAFAGVLLFGTFFVGHYLLISLFLGASTRAFTSASYRELTGGAMFWRGKVQKKEEEEEQKSEEGVQAQHTHRKVREVVVSTDVGARIEKAAANPRKGVVHVIELDRLDDGGEGEEFAFDEDVMRLGNDVEDEQGDADNSGGRRGERKMKPLKLVRATMESVSDARHMDKSNEHQDEGLNARKGVADQGHMKQHRGKQADEDDAQQRTPLIQLLHLVHRMCCWIRWHPLYELFSIGGVVAACVVLGRRPFLSSAAPRPSAGELSVLYITTLTLLLDIVIECGALIGEALAAYNNEREGQHKQQQHQYQLSDSHAPSASDNKSDANTQDPSLVERFMRLRHAVPAVPLHLVMDLIIFFASLADFSGVYGSVAKPLRLYKVAYSRNVARYFLPYLPLVLAGARAALPALLSAIMVWALVCCTYAAPAMRAFGGRFAGCRDASAAYKSQCVGAYVAAVGLGNEALLMPRAWAPAYPNFDDVWSALYTLVVASSMKWSEALTLSIDATLINQQPHNVAHEESAAFFVLFIPLVCAGVFGAMSTIVISGEAAARTDDDRKTRTYAMMLDRIDEASPGRPSSAHASNVWMRAAQYHLSNTAVRVVFEVSNGVPCVFALAYHSHMPTQMSLAYLVHTLVFAAVSLIEVLMHIGAYGTWHFILSIRGFTLTTAAVVSMAGAIHNSPQVLAIGLGARMARAVPSLVGLVLRGTHQRVLHTALALALRRVLAVCLVMLCVVFAASCIAVQAFGHVREGSVLGTGGGGGFSTFSEALITMLMVTCGGPWHVLVMDCGVEAPHCTAGVDCGSRAGAYVFFLVYKFVMQLVLFNMMLAATVEALLDAHSLEVGLLTHDTLTRICTLWRERSDGMDVKDLPVDGIVSLLSVLPEPLGSPWMREAAVRYSKRMTAAAASKDDDDEKIKGVQGRKEIKESSRKTTNRHAAVVEVRGRGADIGEDEAVHKDSQAKERVRDDDGDDDDEGVSEEELQARLAHDDEDFLSILTEIQVIAGLRKIHEQGMQIVRKVAEVGDHVHVAAAIEHVNVRRLSVQDQHMILDVARRHSLEMQQQHQSAHSVDARDTSSSVPPHNDVQHDARRGEGRGLLGDARILALQQKNATWVEGILRSRPVVWIQLVLASWYDQVTHVPGEVGEHGVQLLDAAYPNLGPRGVLGVVVSYDVQFRDVALALVHHCVPACEPESVRVRRAQILQCVRMRIAARHIAAWLRRRAEWRNKWGNPLRLIREEVQRQREHEERIRREERERERALIEEQKRKLEEERLERLKRVPHHNLHTWAAFAAQQVSSQGIPLEILSYFSRCVYYSIHIPVGPDSGSLLLPSVSDPALEKYGYASQMSGSTFRTVALPADAPVGHEDDGDSSGYTPTGLTKALNHAIERDLQLFVASNIDASRRALWEHVCPTMMRFNSRGNYQGFEVQLTWPGSMLGYNGLGLAGAPTTADGFVSVRVYAAMHSAYSMAAARSDAACKLGDALPSLMALMGLCHGSKPYHCHILAGYQGSIVVGGGSNRLTGNPPEDPEADLCVVHHETNVVGRAAFDAALQVRTDALQAEIESRVLAAAMGKQTRANARLKQRAADKKHEKEEAAKDFEVWDMDGDDKKKDNGDKQEDDDDDSDSRPDTATAEATRRRMFDIEFLMSYARDYGNLRVEMLALYVLQAQCRAKVVRLRFLANRKRKQKLGDNVTHRIDMDNFMKNKNRRQASMLYAASQTADQGTNDSIRKTSWMVGNMGMLAVAPSYARRDVKFEQRLEHTLHDTARFLTPHKKHSRERGGHKYEDDNVVSAEDYIRVDEGKGKERLFK